MSDPPQPSKPPVKKARTGTALGKRRRQDQFLTAFRVSGSVREAAKSAGICAYTHYSWLANDPEYRLRYAEATQDAAAHLEEEAWRRAVEGERKLILYRGKPVFVTDETTGERVPLYEINRSDHLLMFLLKGLVPQRYRERQSIEHSGPDGGPIQSQSQNVHAVRQQILNDPELRARARQMFDQLFGPTAGDEREDTTDGRGDDDNAPHA